MRIFVYMIAHLIIRSKTEAHGFYIASGNPLRVVKNRVYGSGMRPKEIVREKQSNGTISIELVYEDESDYNYDLKCFKILFNDL